MSRFYKFLHVLDRLINYHSIKQQQQKKEDSFIQSRIDDGQITEGKSTVKYNPWSGDLRVERTIKPVKGIKYVTLTLKLS